MMWDLHWNDLPKDEKDKIVAAVSIYLCPCSSCLARQAALDAFNAVVDVIKERDRLAAKATLA